MISMNGKPEWFQLIEGDEIKPRHQVKRALRVMALAAPLFVLGTGFVLAQTQDGSHAIASETVSLTSTAPESSTAPPPVYKQQRSNCECQPRCFSSAATIFG